MHARKISTKKLVYAGICLLLAALICLSSIAVIGEVFAAYNPTQGDKFTINYTKGTFVDFDTGRKEEAQVDIVNQNETVTVNSSGCIILRDLDYSGNNKEFRYTGKDGNGNSIDAKSTFYFGVESDGSVATSGCQAFTFTGWMISGAKEKIPGKTVFQPGDVITPDVLADTSNKTITFEAMWGLTYFLASAYDDMTFEKNGDKYVWGGGSSLYGYKIKNEATQTKKYSDDGDGYTQGDAFATIDGLFKKIRSHYTTRTDRAISAGTNLTVPLKYDAYATVIMLISDMYYYKSSLNGSVEAFGLTSDGYTSVTFKSRRTGTGAGDGYTLYTKSKGVTMPVYGNFCFDNIKLSRPWNTRATSTDDSVTQFDERIGTEWQFNYGDNDKSAAHYIEFTSNFNKNLAKNQRTAIMTLRPNAFETCVVNGGIFQTFHTTYSAPYNSGTWIPRTWRIGRNAYFTSSIHGGSQSRNTEQNSTIAGSWTFWITGGSMGSFHGGSNNVYSINVGDRDIHILGDDTRTDTFTNTFYEQDNSTNAAGVSVNGSEYKPTMRGDVTCAGADAELFGDVNVEINNATLKGSLIGGGYDQSAKVHGNIKLDVSDTYIGGNVYGGGYQANCERVGTTYRLYTYNNGLMSTKTQNIEGTSSNTPLPGISKQKDLASPWVTGNNYGGEVTVNLDNCEVKGKINGSAEGGTRNSTVTDMVYVTSTTIGSTTEYNALSSDKKKSTLYYINNEQWEFNDSLKTWVSTAPSYNVGTHASSTGVQRYDSNNGLLLYAYKSFSWLPQSPTQISRPTYYEYAFLSIASAEKVTLNINGTLVHGAVYGGGNIANVNGDVTVNITGGSVIKNSVYGGGNGGTIATVKIYKQPTSYSGPSINATDYNSQGTPSKVAVTNQATSWNSDNLLLGEFTWSNDTSLLDMGGYDEEKKLAYSPNVGEYGKVGGNVTLNIIDSQVRGTDSTQTNDTTLTTLDGELYNKGYYDNGGIGKAGSVYGGGNNGKVGKNITTTITDSIITQTLCGGSRNADVGGNITTLVNGNTLIHDDIYGANHTGGNISGSVTTTITGNTWVARAYGGGYKSNYSGTPKIIVDGNARITHNTISDLIGLFGGCAYGADNNSLEGSIGGTDVTVMGNAQATNVYLGSRGRTNNGQKQGTVKGNAKGILKGNATVSTVFGGGETGDITGDVYLEITDNAKLSNAGYGGGYNGNVNGTVNFHINTDILTGATIYGGGNKGDCNIINLWINGVTIGYDDDDNLLDNDDTDHHSNIFGGCSSANVTGSSTLTFASGSKVYGTVFGGNNQSGTNKKATVNMTDSFISYILYGGNNQGGTATETYINMNGGSTVGYRIYGGNYSDGTTGDTHVTMNDSSSVTNVKNYNIYGGGRQADVTGTTTVILNDNAVAGYNVYGGGENGGVAGKATVIVNDDVIVENDIFGGGDKDDVGEAFVHVNGNAVVKSWLYTGGNSGNVTGLSSLEINDNANVYGNIFGGGNSGDAGSTKVVINGGTICSNGGDNYYNLYGGGNNGSVKNDILVDINGGNFKNEIYGGGKGETEIANVGGSIVVNIDKLDSFASEDNIYGGCNTSGTVSGNVTVNINDSNSTAINAVYGGGKGEKPVTVGDTAVNINYDGTIQYVYGGGKNATVGNTNVTLTKGTVKIGLYGGGEGETAVATGDTEVNINGGEVTGHAFGGGNMGDVNGNVKFNMTAGEVTQHTYCGANLADIGGNIIANFSGGSHGRNVSNGLGSSGSVFGGSRAGNVGTEGDSKTGNITLNFTGGTNWHHTFGGNNQSGTIYGDVVINATDGSFGQLHGGSNGNSWHTDGLTDEQKSGAVIKGNVTVNINGGTYRNDVNCIYGGSNDKGVTEGEITVNVTGGTVKGNVYGGGYSAAHEGKATVIIEATATVGDGTGEDSVMGAGNQPGGYVKETHVNVYGKVYKDVFGGGRNAKVGTTDVNIYDGANVHDVYAGGWGAESKNENGSTLNSATVNVNGGTINTVYGGGQNASAVVNTGEGVANAVTVNIKGGTMQGAYGGGYLAAVNGNVDFNVTGGTVKNNTAAGGFKADINGNVDLAISGGTLGDDNNCHTNDAIDLSNAVDVVAGGGYQGNVTGDINVAVSGSTMNAYFYGGGLKGNVGGNITTDITGGSIYGLIFGGCYGSDVGTADDGDDKGNVTLNITGANINDMVFGGNNHDGTINGDVTVNVSDNATCRVNVYFGGNGNGLGAKITGSETYYSKNSDIKGAVITGNIIGNVTDSVVNNNVYCGNNEKGTTEGDIRATFTGDTCVNHNIFGGGFSADHIGNTHIDIGAGVKVGDSVYGGGNAAYVGRTYITTAGDIGTRYAANSSSDYYSLFGGGATADVGESHVNIVGGNVYGYVYGGGRKGNVGSANVDISGGTMHRDVNGGGKNGTSRVTEVTVGDAVAKTVIEGNVYGGGEGETATVFEGTNVEIDLNYDFTADEKAVTTDSDSRKVGSGESSVTVAPVSSDYSYIAGSVYGGGDLGKIGEGSINTGFNRADISTEAKTNVTVINGNVKGSVFGGGRGIPAEGTEYKLQMGVIFGTTNVDVLGGFVEKNVYGGGEQSRVYANEGKSATNVNIDSNTQNGQSKIAIGGSVFGGGDRGSGNTVNASVPTTVGDSNVTITGNKAGATIYFLHGGVYGDGNLCLVSGNRTITINDLVTDINSEHLKTFYSIQRADSVILNNSEVVLLGAVDLVEEGDDSVYSINRVGHLYMKNGSTVKLDQLVKYLGGLESDVETDRKYIHYGFNGSNGYTRRLTGMGYTTNDIEVLQESEVKHYIRLDVDNLVHDDSEHGDHNVVCVANGLYIDVMKENDEFGPVNGLFTLQLLYAIPGQGGGYVYGDINTSTGDFICTTRMSNEDGSFISGTENDGLTYVTTNVNNKGTWKYMDIIDNVGMYPNSKTKSDYDYYYWYISGDSITNDIKVISYIGTDDTAFSEMSTIPSHVNDTYKYVLESVEGNCALKRYILNETYLLVSSKEVTGNQIAIEYKIGTTSLGFLSYDKDTGKWHLNGKYGMNAIKESDGAQTFANSISGNTLFEGNLPDGVNYIECVLHRSPQIDTVTKDAINVDLTLKLFDGNNHPPENRVHIINLSTDYNIVRVSPSQVVYHENIRNYGGLSMQMPINITKESSFTVEYKTRYIPRTFIQTAALDMAWAINTDNAFPAGTKLSLVDLTGETPTYYYYLCNEARTTVDLEEFMQMGTETAIKDMSVKPAFISNYDEQISSITTERLLVIVDFGSVTNWTWSQDNTYSGEITLSHTYNGTDIMYYTDPETSNGIKPSEVAYSVHENEIGVDLGSFDIEFEADSYPDKGVAQFDVTIAENDVWIDTRYYENEFALKLELVDENGNVRPLPTGITFEANGETFYPSNTNNYANVAIPTYGTYTVSVDTSAYGIKDSLATGDNTVRFKATLYAAPEARYHDFITVNTVDKDEYTIGGEVKHSLYVKTDNTKPTNLVLSGGESFSFDLNTLKTGDSESMVNVECYSKTDAGYTQRVTLSNIFDGSAETLQPTNGIVKTYTGTITADAPLGMYRLVFTYADRTEYIYIIID